MKKSLIIGTPEQIGTELALFLTERYKTNQIIISDVVFESEHQIDKSLTFGELDVLDFDRFCSVVQNHQINYVIHLAAILSEQRETNHQKLWKINMIGLYNALEVAWQFQCGVFTPSSISAFGINTSSKIHLKIQFCVLPQYTESASCLVHFVRLLL